MRELMSLILTISSLLAGVQGGGNAEYSWRQEKDEVEKESVVRAEDDRGVMISKMPVIKRVPVRIPGVARPSVNAESSFVLEATTGRVLYAENRTTVRPLASLTKLMTVLVAVDMIENIDAPVIILKDDYAGGGRSYMYAGDIVTVRDLIFLTLVSSSNDAANALARATGVSQSAFVSAMNARARALRMSYTVFADPTGLHAGNVSTAEEVARLLHTALVHPFLREVLSTKEYRFGTVDGTRHSVAVSTDLLLGNAHFGIVGAKTGYIEESGYNFAMQAAGTKGEILTIVVLGAKSEDARFTIARQLVEWAEKAWEF